MRIALVAGEASGDVLGAGLVSALRERFPGAEFAELPGMGHEHPPPPTWEIVVPALLAHTQCSSPSLGG